MEAELAVYAGMSLKCGIRKTDGFRYVTSLKNLFALRSGTVLLFVVDSLGWLAAVYYGVTLRYVMGRPSEYGEVLPLYPRALLYMAIMLVLFRMLGLYSLRLREPILHKLIRYLAAFLAGAVLMWVAGYMWRGVFLGRGSIALVSVLGFLVVVVTRILLDRFYFRTQHG